MPGLVRQLTIHALENGLLLRPFPAKDHRDFDVQIAYKTCKISQVPREQGEESPSSNAVEAYGLVGLLDLVSTSYLIVITQREQVAQIRSKAIYVVRDVVLIPLSSQAEAEKAIKKAPKSAKAAANSTQNAETDAEADETDVSDVEDANPAPQESDDKAKDAAAVEPSTNVGTSGKDVIQEKGRYGRFASRWFSSNGSKANAKRKQGMASEAELPTKPKQEDIGDSSANDEQTKSSEVQQAGKPELTDTETMPDVVDADTQQTSQQSKARIAIENLAPRIVRSARLFFSWSGFYFSYEHDISGSLMQKGNILTDLPLRKRFDALYFWNSRLIDPFIDAGRDELVLPLMQGFVGQRTFSITKRPGAENDVVAGASQDPAEVLATASTTEDPEALDTITNQTHEFLLTLISRRSIKRAGLRYTRRGVDDEGSVANSVETEQILSSATWDDKDKAFSLLQTRGSIPLHFSQSPWYIKPAPVLYGSDSTNQEALRKHFNSMTQRYKQVQVVSLVSTHPPEAPVGEAFEKHVKQLNEEGGIGGKQVKFEWFDFHTACKGMKFENTSLLIDTLESTFKSFGWIVKQHDRNMRQQKGIVRTNCMDCLDRSNVVQSYIAGWALEQQLAELGLKINLKSDPTTQWFNTLWADNGDAISKQYAGSSALKGDFTRKRKRNWTGALSDGFLTMTRYYNNVFGDYFMQTCIDYYLGNAGPAIFDDFQTNMTSQDFALDMRKIRQNAIDTCVKIAIDDHDEELIGGWTLSCPKESGTLRTLPFEECVLLLTKAASYFCRFDWNTEKVGSFEKVDLRDISELWRGTYITSGLGQTNLDEKKNVGFVMRYKPSEFSVVRRNTRSLLNEEEPADELETHIEKEGQDEQETAPEKEDADDESKEEDADDKDQEKGDPPKDAEKDDSKLLAFKALPPESSAAKHRAEEVESMQEVDLVKHICEEVQRAGEAAVRQGQTTGIGFQDKIPHVEEKDVISVADARKSTGYVESIGYSLKRLVWS